MKRNIYSLGELLIIMFIDKSVIINNKLVPSSYETEGFTKVINKKYQEYMLIEDDLCLRLFSLKNIDNIWYKEGIVGIRYIDKSENVYLFFSSDIDNSRARDYSKIIESISSLRKYMVLRYKEKPDLFIQDS